MTNEILTMLSIIGGFIALAVSVKHGVDYIVHKIEDNYEERLEDKYDKDMMTEIMTVVEEVRTSLDINSDGTKSLLRYRLLKLMKNAIAQGYTNLEEKEVVDGMLQPYKDLKGNHSVDTVYKIYKHLPVKRL